MGSNTSNDSQYKVPFNILVCDLDYNGQDNSTLMKIILGNDYLKLKTKKLRQDDISYIHSELNWLFTPTKVNDISTKLKDYADASNPEMDHTMLLIKTHSIANNQNVMNLLNILSPLIPDDQPMTLFITDSQETRETVNNVIDFKNQSEKRLDKLSFDLVNYFIANQIKEDNTHQFLTILYTKLSKICSYYNQLGDIYTLVNINANHEITNNTFNQRLNIIVLGRPGTGKSTFINKFLCGKRCRVGGGMPKTNKIIPYNHSEYPFSIYDTPGFEKKEQIDQVINLIDNFKKEFKDTVKQIHLFLYFINAQDRTILDEDELFLEQFKTWRDKNEETETPLIFIITRSNTKKKGEDLKIVLDNELKNKFKFDRYQGIFPIDMSDIYQTTQPFGIDELFNELYNQFRIKKINEATKQLYENAETDEDIYALNSESSLLSLFKDKKSVFTANKYIIGGIIAGCCLLVAGIGCLGFASEAEQPIQIMMVTCITLVLGIKTTIAGVIIWLKTNVVLTTFTTINRKARFLKYIPGITVITAGVSTIVMATVGYLWIKKCKSSFNVKDWCIKAIDNFNRAIESFIIMKDIFTLNQEPIIPIHQQQIYEDD